MQRKLMGLVMKALRVSLIALVVVALGTMFVGVHSGGNRPAKAAGVPYAVGDVFAGVGNGMTKHFSASGVLLDTLDSGSGKDAGGMAFDSAGNLYATQFQANTVAKFDRMGNFIGTFGSGYSAAPESIVFNRVGDSFVGEANRPISQASLLKFDPSGALLLKLRQPVPESRGIDWIDLAADQCTLF